MIVTVNRDALNEIVKSFEDKASCSEWTSDGFDLNYRAGRFGVRVSMSIEITAPGSIIISIKHANLWIFNITGMARDRFRSRLFKPPLGLRVREFILLNGNGIFKLEV